MRYLILVPLIPTLALGGCNWVDATGAQAGDRPPPVSVVLDDFAPGDPLPLLEERALRLGVGGEVNEDDVYTWSEEPLEEGPLDSCASVEGFRPELAAATLAEACHDTDDCAFAFERDTESGEEGVGFVVEAPVLRASVGLRHELSVRTADGNTGTSIRDFCLIAVNEAPDAVDDGPFTITEGTTLVVGGPGDPDNLLANDSDDDDVGNQGLVVDTTPVSPPSASNEFELGSDGSFSYTFEDVGIRGSFSDSFVYAISDGVSDPVSARVTLTVVPRDLPPVLALPIVPIEALVGAPLEANLGAGFSDPEGETLTFALQEQTSLPASGSLTLGADGVLVGVPLAADVGDYDVRFVASDGVRETQGEAALSIRVPPNRAPEYVEGSSIDLSLVRLIPVDLPLAEFVDPDGDALSYELIGVLPRGLTFDTTGARLQGRPRDVGTVTRVRVRAVDPSGAEGLSIVFTIGVV